MNSIVVWISGGAARLWAFGPLENSAMKQAIPMPFCVGLERQLSGMGNTISAGGVSIPFDSALTRESQASKNDQKKKTSSRLDASGGIWLSISLSNEQCGNAQNPAS